MILLSKKISFVKVLFSIQNLICKPELFTAVFLFNSGICLIFLYNFSYHLVALHYHFLIECFLSSVLAVWYSRVDKGIDGLNDCVCIGFWNMYDCMLCVALEILNSHSFCSINKHSVVCHVLNFTLYLFIPYFQLTSTYSFQITYVFIEIPGEIKFIRIGATDNVLII